MSITFACDHCGKSFTVGDELGGKKGRCKQCNATISIPKPVGVNVFVASEPKATPARSATPNLNEHAARQVVGRPAATHVEPYDFEPMPGRPARRALGLEDLPGERPRRPKARRSSGAGASAAAVVGKVFLGVVAIFITAVALKTVSPELREFFGVYTTKAEAEAMLQRRTDDNNDLASSFARVRDVPSAAAESARSVAAIRRLCAGLKQIKNVKMHKSVSDSISDSYKFAQDEAFRRVYREAERIKQIPFAWQTLAVDDALNDLIAIEATIPGIQATDVNQGFQAPAPPPVNQVPGRFNFPDRPNFIPPPPNFIPPPPNFTPPLPPNFGRPGGMPTMPPRFNPRRGGRPGNGPPN